MAAWAARGGVVGRAGAVVALLVVALWAVPGAAAGASRGSETRARAAVLFLPWPDGDRSLLRALGARGLAVGSASPTVGGYAPQQVLLDVGQGARVPLGSYAEPPPAVALALRGNEREPERITEWGRAMARAREAPAAVVPGLLGEAAARGGARVAYAGPSGQRNAEAAVAANRSGRVTSAEVFGGGAVGPPLASLWAGADLLVGRLPAGAAGLGALDALVRARRPGDLVLVLRAPPARSGRTPLLAMGIAGPRFRGQATMVSATTRRPGLVAATDVAPTVLRALRTRAPRAMQGEPIRPSPVARPAASTLHDRLTSLLARRRAALVGLLVAWIAMLGGLTATRGDRGARAGVRLGLLAALWIPGLALATAAAAPRSVVVEAAALALGSLILATATDRLLPWPGGPALPAAVAALAYAIDLAAGSTLTSLAVTGPNPAAGARFYGVGNELEMILSLALLLGTGAAAAAALARRRAAALAFAGAGVVGALVMAPGRLGADVGAVITLASGAAAAAAFTLPAGRERRVALLLVVIAPLAGVAALAGVDLATAGGAHLSRSVVEAPDAGWILDVGRRRIGTQLALLGSPGGAVLALACLALIVAGVHRREAILGPPVARGARPVAAALVGALVAVLAGALANDSPTDMLAIGAAVLLLAAAYARAAPPPPAPGTSRGERSAPALARA